MPIQTSDNKWSVSKWIVDPVAGLGTHTTIQSAVDDAYNQDGGGIVCIRTGEYTENVVLPPNICLTALGGDSLNGIIQLIGKVSMTQSGLSSIYGLYFNTNGDVAIEVSGSAASLLYIYDCNLRSSSNNLINFSSSSSSAELVLNNCSSYLFTTGISLFTSSSPGQIALNHVTLTNVANSTTSSTISAGRLNLTGASFLQNGITSSGTGSILVRNASIDTSGNNSTCLTCGGSGLHQVVNSFLASGSATALTANTTTSIYNSTVASSNTNAIDGSSTLNYSGIIFSGTSFKINTTTQSGGIAQGGRFQAPSVGYLGERLVSSVAQGSAVNIPTDTYVTITTLDLTAGVWDISAIVGYTGTPGSFNNSAGGISNNASAWSYPVGDGYVSTTQVPSTNNDTFVSVPAYRLVLTSSGTIRLLATANFSSSTLAGYGRISATRVG